MHSIKGENFSARLDLIKSQKTISKTFFLKIRYYNKAYEYVWKTGVEF